MPLDILTNRYDNNRSGVNSEETILKPDNVEPDKFGKLFTRTVDGDLYAQPLIVDGLIKDGEKRASAVILATSRNWVYCYEAESASAYVPVWTRQLGPAVPRDEILWQPGKKEHYLNFGGEIGITSTPAIAREGEGGVLYVVAKTIQGSHATAVFEQKLYALDLLTGQDRIAPTRIEVDLLPGRPGIAFSPKFNLNRPGLLLQNGVVYLAFGSHDDNGDYCGWILAYDAKMLKQLAAYNTTPDWGEGGIWQSGTGLAGDGECVYAVVGNGKETGDRTPPNPVTKPEYGNALLKLKLDATAGVLKIVDWFTTKNVFAQNDDDVDLIGGPVLFEAEAGPKGERRSFLLGGGKDGHFYLAYRDKLGCWTPDNSGILQAKQLCEYHIHGAPVVWSSGRGNTFAYVWSERDALKSFKLGSQGFGPPRQFSEVRFPVMEDRMPGGILTLSWDGTDPESAILWASHPTRENAMNKTVAGTLRAFKATDLTRELWNSDMDPAGDDRIGSFAKFSPAVVANGRVYIGTFSRELAVYGLLDEPRFDMGDFELRNIGDVDKLGSYAAGRYVLKLGGAGIGVLPEGFLFANREHNLADSDLKLTARFVGFNVDHLATPARAGLLVRDGFEAGKGAMVALVIDRDGHAFVLARDQPDKPDSKSPAKKVRKIGRTRMPGAPTNLRLIVADAGDKGNVRVTAEVGKALVGEWEVLTDFVMKWDVASNAAVKFGMFATEQNHGAEPRPASAPPGQAKFSKVEFPGA